MVSRMISEGTGNGLFHPERNVTRVEFAAIIVRGLGLKPEPATAHFTDVKVTDWYNGVFNTAYAYNLDSGLCGWYVPSGGPDYAGASDGDYFQGNSDDWLEGEVVRSS